MTTTPTGSPTRKTPSRTPLRRAISAEPPSSRHSIHTPLDRSVSRDLRNSTRRTPGSIRRSNAPTPHAKAARHALHQRRTAMFTPGKNRRRSLMEQRETPLGILRNLSRALAPTTKPIVSSSSTTSSSPRDKTIVAPIREGEEEDDDYDDLDDDFPIDRPRLSLPIGQDDDDEEEEELRPPRLSQMFDDENYTVQSIELPRRAVSETPGSRLSRGSIGSIRMSDYFNDGSEDVGEQSDFFPGLLEDLQARAGADEMSYERLDVDPTRQTVLGRESDFNFDIPLDVGEQTTFVMSEPREDAATTPPAEERSVVEADALEAQDGVAGDVYGGSDDYDMPGFDDHSDLEDDVQEQTQEQAQEQTQGLDLDEPIEDATISKAFSQQPTRKGNKVLKKRKKISRHGIEYPSLPASFVKRVSQTALQSSGLSNARISPDTLEALVQVSEWFFEQLGDDLGAYASHAKRKTIEESDVITLMRRQRQISGNATMFSLAQRHLPRELLQELRMPVPQPTKPRRAERQREDDEEAAEIT